MEPFEVMISESQERMLAVIRPDRWEAVRQVCERWGLPVAIIGTVTDDGDITVVAGNREVARIPAAALTSDAIVHERVAARLSDAGRVACGCNGAGGGVVIALPVGACAVAETARVLRYLAQESAGQCGPCVFGLAAVAEEMEEIAVGAPRPSASGRIERWSADIAGRGACHHPDGALRLVRSCLRTFAAEVAEHVGSLLGLVLTVCSIAVALTLGSARGTAAKQAAFKAAWIYVGPHNDGGWSQAHDQGRLYVAGDIVPAYKNILRDADLILPNQFEAELLSGVTILSLPALATAASRWPRCSPTPGALSCSWTSRQTASRS